MRLRTSRPIACLLALSISLALGGASMATASATTGGGVSDPAALAVLRQAQAIAMPSHALQRMSLAAPEPKAAEDQGDATPMMVALARVYPRLDATDQATARAILSPSTFSCAGDTVGTYQTLETDHFAISYTTTAGDSNAVDPKLSNGENAYVAGIADILENHVYAHEITQMGFHPPLVKTGTLIPIQLCNISPGYYGYCAPDPTGTGNARAASCTLRNSYDPATCSQAHPSACIYYDPRLDGSDVNAPVKVTAAHEFFHAVQFAQNAFPFTDTPPLWLMEGTAVWMESQVYPGIHDYLQYLPATAIKNPGTPFNIKVTSDDFSDSNGALWPFTVYGNFAFFKFLSGWLHDNGAVRQLWNYLGAHHGVSPMTAVNAVLGVHRRALVGMLLNWSIWNTLPPGSYPDRGIYAPVGWWQIRKLDRSKRRYTSPLAQVRPYADAPIRINRGANVRPGTRLRVVVSGPSYRAGGYYTYRISRTNGTQLTVTRQIGLHGSAFIIPFNRSVSFAAFTLNNTSPSRTKAFRISTTVLP